MRDSLCEPPIYARYTSELQSAASIEDQIRLCRERLEQENGTVVDVYVDYAISGSSIRNRPSMQALLDQAKRGKFDHVIAEALDRVSRDQEDTIYKRLRYSNIRFFTLAEGEIALPSPRGGQWNESTIHGAGRRLLKDLQQVERAIKRCLDFITGGDGDPGCDQLRHLEARKREIDADLKGHQGEMEIAIHPNLPDLYRINLLKDLVDKTRRGLRGRIEQGRSGGGLCYGYRITRPADEQRGGREIDEAQAAVVRRIFASFAAGNSPRAIAAELNAEGIPGPGGRPRGTTIRGHALRGTGVLRNELYVGRLPPPRVNNGRRRLRLQDDLENAMLPPELADQDVAEDL
jgi:DNA invertase Pin-like site-specific DNA recombinase